MNREIEGTILVAGGAGFIGSNFIRRIHRAHPEVRIVNFDKLTYAGNVGNLADIAHDSRYIFVRGDVADRGALASVCAEHRPDYVINFAAESHVDRSIHGDAEEFMRTNVHGVFVLLETMRRSPQVKKFVQVSTDEVYGDLPLDSGNKKFVEESGLRPNSPYDSSKAAGDLLCRAYFRTFGVPVVVTRCGNNYGPYQYPEKLIPYFILRVMDGKKVPLYGDGGHVRDWVHVEDHCAALERCLLAGKPGEMYNIGAGNERSNKAIAHFILKHFGADESRIEFVADRPGHDRRYALDASKIEKELGWKSVMNFEDSLADTIAWYRTHQDWMRSAWGRIDALNPHIPLASHTKS